MKKWVNRRLTKLHELANGDYEHNAVELNCWNLIQKLWRDQLKIGSHNLVPEIQETGTTRTFNSKLLAFPKDSIKLNQGPALNWPKASFGLSEPL